MIFKKKSEKPFLIKLEKLSWSKPGNFLVKNLFVQLAFEAPAAVIVVLAGIFCFRILDAEPESTLVCLENDYSKNVPIFLLK